jgi:hypothetical protein
MPHPVHARDVNAQFNGIADHAEVGKLEVNANGQWAWIQDETGLPIAAALADALETRVVQRAA